MISRGVPANGAIGGLAARMGRAMGGMQGGDGSARARDARAFTRRLVVVGIVAAAAIAFAIVRFGPPGGLPGASAAIVTSGPAADLLAVGDVGECPMVGARATARLAERLPGTIALLGDEAYPNGSDHDFATCFAPAWGPLLDRTRPVPGNHEYRTADAAPYFRYFGRRAGRPGEGWYSYELGTWHVVAINSSLDVGPGSPQLAWLRDDLAAAKGRCVLAYWHTPRFSIGPHGDRWQMIPIWDALSRVGAAVVLAGHDHMYQRFAPMTSDGHPDAERGMREFVVGTGGAGRYRPLRRDDNLEAMDAGTWGVLHLRLMPDSYSWEFVPVEGSAFRDSGQAPCHPR